MVSRGRGDRRSGIGGGLGRVAGNSRPRGVEGVARKEGFGVCSGWKGPRVRGGVEKDRVGAAGGGRGDGRGGKGVVGGAEGAPQEEEGGEEKRESGSRCVESRRRKCGGDGEVGEGVGGGVVGEVVGGGVVAREWSCPAEIGGRELAHLGRWRRKETSSAVRALVEPVEVAAEGTTEAATTMPREAAEVATTPRVRSKEREGEPSSVGTEQREARLSGLSEESADVSAWFEGVGEGEAGLESPREREGAAPQGAARLGGSPQGTAARCVREGLPIWARRIWRRGKRRAISCGGGRGRRREGGRFFVEGAGAVSPLEKQEGIPKKGRVPRPPIHGLPCFGQGRVPRHADRDALLPS